MSEFTGDVFDPIPWMATFPRGKLVERVTLINPPLMRNDDVMTIVGYPTTAVLVNGTPIEFKSEVVE